MGFMSKGMKSFVKNNKFNALFTAAMLPMSIDEYEQKRADGHGALTSQYEGGIRVRTSRERR